MSGNIVPQKAIVKPRVISQNSGEIVPLEDLAEMWLSLGRGGIEIVGGPGSGKTTALAHLASLPVAERCVFHDDARKNKVPSVPHGKALMISSRFPNRNDSVRLAKWTDDDVIEYLLATAPERCGDVIERFRKDPDSSRLDGNPQLIALVIEQMLKQPEQAVFAAFRNAIASQVPNKKIEKQARLFSMTQLLDSEPDTVPIEKSDLEKQPELMQLLKHRIVRMHFAAAQIVYMLESRMALPNHMLPLELIRQIAAAVEHNERAQTQLFKQLSSGVSWRAPVAASILHCLDSDWSSRSTLAGMYLHGGHFAGVDWEERKLQRINLFEADVRESNLSAANLKRAILKRTDFSRSNLASAYLKGADASQANFSRTNLCHAVLRNGLFDDCSFASSDLSRIAAVDASFRGARFARTSMHAANLERANFERATFTSVDMRQAMLRRAVFGSADLRDVDLDRAILNRATLVRCNLEGVTIEYADCSLAVLRDALLTGSTFKRVNLRGAKLTGSGLADINWTNCDLRGAHLNNCSFHLGSTRCGHVDSPYPSHGTRTGFYTDDFDAHQFQAPESIRKAALCGCDLRDIDVRKTDFYLVDLRGARYDSDQEQHFRSCKAILDDWNKS